jgi:hypothetical protein
VGITFARVTLSSVDVRGNMGGGITVNDGSTVDMTDAVLSGTTTMGVYAEDAATVVTLVDTEVSDTAPTADGLFGRGVEAGVGAEVHLERARLSGNELYGSEGVPLGNWQAHGNAVYAWGGVQRWDGTSGLLLGGNTFVDAEAVAVLLNGAGATLDGNVFQGSAREVHQQRCEGVPRVPSPAAGWEICDGGALLTDDSMLFDTLYVPEVALAE